MDSSADSFIIFDDGTCNYCNDYIKKKENYIYQSKFPDIESLVIEVKKSGENKKYDSIIGVSGGVDSSWVLVKSVEMGLRPLAVHMDNGWNSELAQNNISNIINSLEVDLFTYVIDWNEYRDLQKAFFSANVIDIELLYDNALMGVNYSQSRKYGIKYILSGSNLATEGVTMPPNWAKNNKLDYKNIKKIWKSFGEKYSIKSFPGYGFYDYIYDLHFKGTRWIPFLNYIDYNKESALELLTNEYGYKPYPYKHYESIFTRFYQGYILPEKFNVDKRKNHLSALILNEELSRDDAVKILNNKTYISRNELEQDQNYFLKKFDWQMEKLIKYISEPEIKHSFYGSENWKFNFFSILVKYYKKLKKYLINI